MVDATFDWHVQADLTLGMQLNNLFDRQYATTSDNGRQQWYLGEPRSFFVTADYSSPSDQNDLHGLDGELGVKMMW